VQAALDAGRARRWSDVARLADEQSLRDFQERWLGNLRNHWMPTNGGELHEVLRHEFDGVRSPDDLAALPPATALERWLAAHDPVRADRRHLVQTGESVSADARATADAAYREHRLELLGHVTETPDVAHVVYVDHDAAWRTNDHPSPRVASTRRGSGGGSWRVVVTDSLLYDGVLSGDGAYRGLPPEAEPGT
jgi:hypothetical protein